MNIFLAIVILLLLFIILNFGADLVIFNLKEIGNKLGIKLFFLGIILGLITSLPELAVGMNAAIKGIPSISLGNLLGGIVVLLGLILGASSLLQREIKTDGETGSFLPVSLIILLPLFLSLDGLLGIWDGAVMICAYLLLVWLVYRKNRSFDFPIIEVVNKRLIAKEIFYIISGLVLVILSSSLILRIVEYLLKIFTISPLLIGVLLFSLGTNLPEITIAFKAWRKKSSELSISNLIGSAVANIFVLGTVAIAAKINIVLDREFILLTSALIVLVFLFGLFYKTGKKFSTMEGAVLLTIYCLFLFLQTYFIF